MNKITRFIQNYLLIGLPFVLTCMVWSSIYPESSFYSHASALLKTTWVLISIHTMLWFLVLMLFLVALVMLSQVREMTLRRLANLKERDEREQHITGKACRITYMATLSLTLALLFFSVFSLNIYRLPQDQALHEKKSIVGNMGIHLVFLKKNELPLTDEKTGQILFSTDHYALLTSAILLLLLCWQLAIFNLNVRKTLKTSRE